MKFKKIYIKNYRLLKEFEIIFDENNEFYKNIYKNMNLIFKWFSKSKKIVNSIRDIKEDKNFNKNEIEILKIIFRKQKLKNHLNNLLEYFCMNLDELKRLKKIYKHQRKELKKGNYNISPIDIKNDMFKELFVHYFFEELFEDKIFMEKILLEKFSKKIFKENFKIKVCPYCNIEEIYQSENLKIDHFLPKSLFPLLSMYYLNLIPICDSCNSKNSGKGNSIKNPISNQFYEEIGEEIQFVVNIEKKYIELTSEEKSILNFIDLLKLNKKYGTLKIYEELIATLKSFDNYINYLKTSEEKKRFYYYYKNELKNKNLYYLKKSILSTIDN